MLPAGLSSPTAQTHADDDDMVSVVSHRLTSWAKEHQQFHQHGTFFAIWLLVMFVGIEILTKARSILEPILWAFFLMMGLVPFTDMIEEGLFRAIRFFGAFLGCGRCKREKSNEELRHNATRMALRSQKDATASSRDRTIKSGDNDSVPVISTFEFPGECERGATPMSPMSDAEASSASSGSSERSAYSAVEDGKSCQRGGWLRTVAVLFSIVFTVGCGALFFVMVYKSAIHMQNSWPHYKRGAQIVSHRLTTYLQRLPDDMVQKYTNKALESMESALVGLVNGVLEATSHTCLEIMWVLLYMIFWLCQPVHIGKDVSAVFRRYIFLKGFASAGYAFCIWVLLHFIGVDLAIVFGLITFVFNFIPEVGPFIAMLLPLPVILFDDRMANPFQCMLLALVGQLSLKVVFGNIVEIKLIESQQEMRMHPVVILFFVAFFQYIWGATGMLLSVPIVAALKATLHKIPPSYRDPILIFLEGDKAAPAKWKVWRENLSDDSAESTRE